MTPEHTALVARLIERANYTSSLPEKVLELDAAAALREQAGEVERLKGELSGANISVDRLQHRCIEYLRENDTLRAEVAGLKAEVEKWMNRAAAALACVPDDTPLADLRSAIAALADKQEPV